MKLRTEIVFAIVIFGFIVFMLGMFLWCFDMAMHYTAEGCIEVLYNGSV